MASQRSLHVLVADDDRLVCEATTNIVKFLGYSATGVTNGLEALALFSEIPRNFDLAIIEPIMPEITGLDLAAALRCIRPGFPVLFYAGFFDHPSYRRIETRRLGRIAFKPLSSRELDREIEGALGSNPRASLSGPTCRS